MKTSNLGRDDSIFSAEFPRVSDLRRVCICGCILIVVLRIAIGWQFLYEGMWKINSTSTAHPWSAEGYLKNAQGPMRDFFRNMTGDPDDLNWLDPKKVARKWDVWFSVFVGHYKLTDDQQKRLLEKINGPTAYYARLSQLPEGVKIDGPNLPKAVQFEANRKRLSVPADWHMVPKERDALLRKVKVEENPAEEDKAKNDLAKEYQKAVRDVYARQSRLCFKQQLDASLIGDPDRAGLIQAQHKGTIDYKRKGEIDVYQSQLARYKSNLAKAQTDFQFEHLNRQWKKLQALRATVVGPVKALDAKLKEEALAVLTDEQLAIGPMRPPSTRVDQINQQTMWALAIIGALLMLGLFSRLSALAGAALLTMFYLASPPWPGVPPAPGPEHSFIVNKNLIEVFALLAIASIPTGRWFGLDAVVRRFILRRRTD